MQNIKLSSMKAKAAEDLADEGDVAGAAIVEARNKFLTQVSVHAHITFDNLFWKVSSVNIIHNRNSIDFALFPFRF